MNQQCLSDLVQYRKRMRFTQNEVIRLLGWKNPKGLIKIESGAVVPTLRTAFKLSIIYRVPVEFLFSSAYQKLREQVRTREMQLASNGHPALPLTFRQHDS